MRMTSPAIPLYKVQLVFQCRYHGVVRTRRFLRDRTTQWFSILTHIRVTSGSLRKKADVWAPPARDSESALLGNSRAPVLLKGFQAFLMGSQG